MRQTGSTSRENDHMARSGFLGCIGAVSITLCGAVTTPGGAADVSIGRATEQNALDPLFSDLGNDVATAENMFESLIRFDAKLRIVPSLALSVDIAGPAHLGDQAARRGEIPRRFGLHRRPMWHSR